MSRWAFHIRKCHSQLIECGKVLRKSQIIEGSGGESAVRLKLRLVLREESPEEWSRKICKRPSMLESFTKMRLYLVA